MDAIGCFVLFTVAFLCGCACTSVALLATFRIAQITEAIIDNKVKEEVSKANQTADL
jgi:hypothetical protein